MIKTRNLATKRSQISSLPFFSKQLWAFFAAALLLSVSHSSTAQELKGNTRIIGSVADSVSKEPVQFATISLNDIVTNKPVTGAICDPTGNFAIKSVPPGQYLVVVSFIGYDPKIIRGITVTDKREDINLGNIIISPSVKMLNEVEVVGEKALFEEKVDRTVYNAENDDTARGGDAADVLRRVPMLTVDLDGNVSMRGNSNVLVLINNRPSTITAGSVADALRQIPADQIKSVEVITSPSAKYDAEGSAGIINIILKKNVLQGATLNIDSGVGNRGANLGVNGSYRKGKMGFTLGGFGRTGYNITGRFENDQLTRSIGSGLETFNTQRADTRNFRLFGNYTLGWDYDINKNNYITTSVRFGARNNVINQDGLLTSSFFNNNLISSSLRDVEIRDLSNTVDVNFNYTHLFEKPQQEFSILGLYSRNNRTNDFVNLIKDEDGATIASRLKNLNDSYNEETAIQADYQSPIGKKQMLEFGAKGIMRRVTSDFTTFRAGEDGIFSPVTNASLANFFTYDQNITAGYFSYTLNAAKNFSLKAGMRYEYTTIQANFADGDEVEIPSYGALVPSLNLSKRLKNGNTLKAAYNRRLQRPSLQFLNPNIQAANPLNITIGNPNLEPEFTDNFELSYSTSIKGTNLNFSTFMRKTSGAIQQVRDVIGSDTIQTTFQNIGQEDAYGFNIFANVNIAKKLSLNGGTDIFYAVLNNNVPDPLFNASNEGWVISYRLFGSYKISDMWALQFFGFMRGRQVQLQGSQGGFGVYSMSLRRDFKNKKGSIGLGVENFLQPSFKIRNTLTSPVIDQNGLTVLDNRGVRLNFSYRLGKLTADPNPRRKRKTISNDDLKDGGDNQGDNVQPSGGSGGGRPQQGARPGAGGPPATQGQRPAGAPGSGAPGGPPNGAPAQKPVPSGN
jgi:outer membrane receptor protein involved in Fe transport